MALALASTLVLTAAIHNVAQAQDRTPRNPRLAVTLSADGWRVVQSALAQMQGETPNAMAHVDAAMQAMTEHRPLYLTEAIIINRALMEWRTSDPSEDALRTATLNSLREKIREGVR